MIARNLKDRSDDHRAIGVQLDSLIDIVSFSVFPASFIKLWKVQSTFLPGHS